ncbi:VIT1/CCC1 transporter family protein [Falsiroseomonas sp. HW251]|uniref:VIT1/CCC1 transporter family protein n=1 Tax=Falsiroseomonas sp. HW251 TaxID=3390998 RepID=UPI003D318376
MTDAPIEPTRDGLPPMPPGPPHEEKHFAEHETVRDLVIGVADGIAVPFALAAALAAASAPAGIVIEAGLAAVAAVAVARGLGGYLGARSEAENYALERLREEEESRIYPEREKWEVAAILHRYGVRGEALRMAVDCIAADRKKWVDFMMRFELELTEPDPNRAARSAVTIAAASVAGGLVPLLPYMAAGTGRPALLASCALTGAALFVFGWLKARATGLAPLRGAVQALAIGAGAAVAAYVAAGVAG